MKSLVGGSAALAATVLAGYFLLNTQPLLAETISLQQQEQTKQEKKQTANPAEKSAQAEAAETEAASSKTETASIAATGEPAAAAEHYTATAYSFRGRTASGRSVGKGIIAADTKVLPIGTRVRLDAGNWSGDYTVADTGGAIRGRRIDVWVPSTGEACRFGRRKVKLTVLSYGGRQSKAKAKR